MNKRMFRHTAHITIIAAAALAATVAVLVPAVFKGARTLAAPVPAFQAAVAKAAAVPTKQALIDAVAVRLTLLRNIVASYDMSKDYTPQRALVAALKARMAIPGKGAKAQNNLHIGYTVFQGVYTFHCRLRRLDKRVFYDSTASGQTVSRWTAPGGDNAGIVKSIRSYTPRRDEWIIYDLHFENRPLGTIQKSGTLWIPDNLAFTLEALGTLVPSLRAGSKKWHWFRPGQLKSMVFTRISNDRFSLCENRMAAPSFYYKNNKRFPAPPCRYSYIWTYQTTPALELLSLEVFIKEGSGKRQLLVEAQCGNFQDVGGVILPGKVGEIQYGGGAKMRPAVSTVLDHIKYSIGAASNTPASYMLTFPLGSQVLDVRSHRRFRIGTRPRQLTDQALAKLELKNNLRRQQVQPWQR